MIKAHDYRADSFEAVVETIDEGLKRLPSYMDLYFKWERQQWSVQDLEFTADRKQWEADAPAVLRQNRMNGFVGFFSGEIDVTNTLGPFINAAPRLDQRIFLTTQLVDEARHVVFFDKWFTEVLGTERAIVGDQMSAIEQRPFGRYIFKQLLPEISRDLSNHPDNLKLLVEGITLYHVIIEGALALAGQTRILQTYKQGGIFPGFQTGFTAVARDESRHVLFGLKFLHDMVQADEKYAHIIMDFINTLLPDMYLSGRPLPEMVEVYRKAGQDVDFTPKFYASSLRRHLRAVGIQASIPDPQPTPVAAELMTMAA